MAAGLPAEAGSHAIGLVAARCLAEARRAAADDRAATRGGNRPVRRAIRLRARTMCGFRLQAEGTRLRVFRLKPEVTRSVEPRRALRVDTSRNHLDVRAMT
jgi:hypothetical protein